MSFEVGVEWEWGRVRVIAPLALELVVVVEDVESVVVGVNHCEC